MTMSRLIDHVARPEILRSDASRARSRPANARATGLTGRINENGVIRSEKEQPVVLRGPKTGLRRINTANLLGFRRSRMAYCVAPLGWC